MAEEKKSEDGYDVMWGLLGFIVVLFLVITLVGRALSNFNDDETSRSINGSGSVEEEKNNGLFSFLTSSDSDKSKINLGDNVTTKEEIDVYDNPAGEIIGQQDYNSFGRIIEGPEDRFNQTWWRIDFEKRPDGWVVGSDLTNNLFWARIVNFFGTIYDWLRPFMILISIILFALILWVLLKKRDLDNLKKKKEEFKEEQKKLKTDPLAASISDLPVPNLPIGEDVIKTENVSNKRWQNIQSLINFHKQQNVQATLTAVYPPGRFGALDLRNHKVTTFKEKPKGDGGMINGGFFVLDPKIFDYIDGDHTIFEKEPLETLAKEKQLMAFKHDEFWRPMDTLRDKNYLENLSNWFPHQQTRRQSYLILSVVAEFPAGTPITSDRTETGW
jgi:hypothetical protein